MPHSLDGTRFIKHSVKDLFDITQVMFEIKNAGDFFRRKLERNARCSLFIA